jgi:hypothetical protein
MVSPFPSPHTVTTRRYSWLDLWWTRRIEFIQGSIRALTSFYGMVANLKHQSIFNTRWFDRCSNKVAITSQNRLQPMDKWEDYPIKVLDMALLIMVTLSTVSSFFSTCGCFLRVGWSSSGDLPPLSLSCWWPLSVNGSLLCEWRRLQGLKVEDPSGAMNGGLNRPRN